MAARAEINTENLDEESLQTLIINMTTKCKVTLQVDNDRNRIDVTGNKTEVNKAEEYAENGGAQVLMPSGSMGATLMAKTTTNAAAPVPRDIITHLTTTEITREAERRGMGHKTIMLPAKKAVGIVKMGDHIEIGDPSLEIYVQEKNLTTMETDVIVNPRDSNFAGGLVTASLEKFEPEIKKACQDIMKGRNNKPMKAGELVHTTGGRLPCRQVIHSVSQGHDAKTANEQMEFLSNLIGSILNHADYKLEAISIAIPGLFGGHAGHPSKAVAKAITDGIMSYARDPNRAFMKKIYLVDINPEIVKEWKKSFDIV